MSRNRLGKRIKRNKYRIFLLLALLILLLFIFFVIKKISSEYEISKYDSEIIIVKGSGDQLYSLTLKELRKMDADTKNIRINNGLQTTSIEGISIEKILGNLDYNLKDSSVMVVEDDEGNSKKIAMSDVLDPGRVYIVYKINGDPIFDVDPKYGKFMIVDTSLNSSEYWITNVKTLDIQ